MKHCFRENRHWATVILEEWEINEVSSRISPSLVWRVLSPQSEEERRAKPAPWAEETEQSLRSPRQLEFTGQSTGERAAQREAWKHAEDLPLAVITCPKKTAWKGRGKSIQNSHRAGNSVYSQQSDHKNLLTQGTVNRVLSVFISQKN